MRIAAIIVAAGRGSRAATANDVPTQYARIGGETVLALSVRALGRHPDIALLQVVIHPDDHDAYAEVAAAVADPRLLPPVDGAATRQLSGLAGLEALAPPAPDGVLIHDAARPFVDAATLARVIGALDAHCAVIPGVAVADTLKRVDAGGLITGTVDREGLWRAQTPQGFRFAAILDAHRRARDAGRTDFTDDAALAEWAGLPVAIVEGSEGNRKITTREDLAMASAFLAPSDADKHPARAPSDADKHPAHAPDIRTGTGFDVHRFAAGDHVWLGGVRIPHTHRLDGHSDADVALHALTDALLGAIGDGDIGQHFPPSDPQWKGAASRLFLADAARRVTARGGRIGNVDLTILCEAPRIGPHREAMRAAIAGILGIEVARVGVKATTTEGLGFTGRREGIAAMATATVVLRLAPG